MRWTAGLMLVIMTIGCSGSSDVVSPASPSPVASIGPNTAPDSSAAPLAQDPGMIRVPGDYATIQAAVNAAEPGDKIQVASGVYCENVVISKANLQLQTPPGANRAVITGDCSAVNQLGAGIHVMNAQGVEIMGFIVEHFEWGIQLMNTTGSRVHLNEVRNNTTVPRTGVGARSRGVGIQLLGSSFNMVSQNDLHDNGRNGININGPSAGAPSNENLVRANWLKDNNQENAVLNGACNLMVNGYARDNTIAENEVLGTYGVGIMIGGSGGAPGSVTGNRFVQNRVHGFGGPGIFGVGLTATGNVIEQNDARTNGQKWATQNVDLWDSTSPVANTWARNLGTCGPGVC